MRAFPVGVLIVLALTGCRSHKTQGQQVNACRATNPTSSETDNPSACQPTAETTQLPVALAAASAAVWDGYVYVVGGFTDTAGENASAKVFSTQIDPTTGELGAFVHSDNFPSAHLGIGLAGSSLVADNGFLYLIGGAEPTSQVAVPLDEVWVAAVTNGSVGQWNQTSSLPTGRMRGAAVVLNGFVYSITGIPAGNSSMLGDVLTEKPGPVYCAPIESGGTLGEWIEQDDLPGGRSDHAAVVAGNFIYVIGGNYNGATKAGDSNEILVAKQNPDGTLGCWAQVPRLISDSSAGAAAVVGSNLVVIEGQSLLNTGDSFPSVVLSAELNNDGSMNGGWTQIATLSDPGQFRAVASNATDLYAIGDDNAGTLTKEVVRLSFDGGSFNCTDSI